ncbi:MAG: ABC transporter ATP-binding protein [Deltaproteobacteria bacterium]|nr:MAG: ABC transporter ATP-binding protein [Deltaproteobacteria bacterium]
MIEISQLEVHFGQVHAVDGLSLRIPTGSFYGLLGPNGAGKTTTLHCLAGLRRPDGGTIRAEGVDAVAEPRRLRRLLGLAPQHLALYPTLSVEENLRIFGGLAGLSGRRLTERVNAGLALASLESRRNHRVETLSGGMKRRLNLACAMLHDPRILICDEPTTGVDPQSRNHIFETLRALRDAGRTIVYTTHHLEEVEALCDRVAIVDHGRLVAEGELPALLEPAKGIRSYEIELAEPTPAEAVRAALADGRLAVTSVRPAERSLEDLFLELTGRALRDADAGEAGSEP